MRLAIRHVTTYRYAPAADRPSFRLKLYPTRLAHQVTHAWTVSMNGEDVPTLFVNGFGDAEAIWTRQGACAEIEVVAEGVVETSDSSGVLRGASGSVRPGVFLRATPLTQPDDDLRDLAERARRQTPLDALHALMHTVRDAVEYTPSATCHETSAAEALRQGAGVCQDHAHIFVTGARLLDIPARYVAGYLLSNGTGNRETHAWAEAYVPDLGWVGFDPSNRQCPTDAYVRLAGGFDASDAAPMRGCIRSGVCEGLSAAVQIAQESAQAQQ
jgi:transglutaminase-like putative cysteine protease